MVGVIDRYQRRQMSIVPTINASNTLLTTKIENYTSCTVSFQSIIIFYEENIPENFIVNVDCIVMTITSVKHIEQRKPESLKTKSYHCS